MNRNNDIVIFRKSVASDGTLYLREDGPIHARDIEVLTKDREAIKLAEVPQHTNNGNSTESRPVSSPLGNVCRVTSLGRKVAIPGKQDRECRTTTSRTLDVFSVKGVRGDVPIQHRATQPRGGASKNVPGLILGTSEHVIEPCTHKYKLRPRTINHMAAAVSAGNMFCALATMVFNTDLSDSNTEDVMSTSFLPPEPVTRHQAMRGSEADYWIEAEKV